MKKSYRFSFFLFLIVSLFVRAAHSQQVNRQIENERQILSTSVTYLLDAAQEKEALKVTRAFLLKHPNDPEAYRQMGIIRLFNNDPIGANKEFERALEIHNSPVEKSIDLYLMAKAWNLSENEENVRATLQRMNEIDIAQAFVKKAVQKYDKEKTLPILNKTFLEKRYLASLPAANSDINKSLTQNTPNDFTQEKNLTVSTSIVLGQDSNPIFIPDGSATKNEAASAFVSTSLDLNKRTQLAGDWVHSLSIGATNYIEEIAQGFNNFRWSYGANLNPDVDWLKMQKITLSNSLEQSFQTQAGFEYFYTADTLSVLKASEPFQGHSIDYQLKLGHRSYANKEMTDKSNDRSGFQWGGGITHKTKISEFPWTSSIGFASQKTYGGLFDTLSLDLITNLQQIVFGDFEILYGLSLGQMTYPNNNDKSYDLMTGLGLEIVHSIDGVQGLATKLSFAHSQNRSDSSTSNFTQDIISIWVNYDLF